MASITAMNALFSFDFFFSLGGFVTATSLQALANN
jgi:hypothetical protein